jgi:hypothetical protein
VRNQLCWCDVGKFPPATVRPFGPLKFQVRGAPIPIFVICKGATRRLVKDRASFGGVNTPMSPISATTCKSRARRQRTRSQRDAGIEFPGYWHTACFFKERT